MGGVKSFFFNAGDLLKSTLEPSSLCFVCFVERVVVEEVLAPWETPSENHIKAQITIHPYDATKKVMTFPKKQNVPLPPVRAPLLAPLASHRSLGPGTNDMCRVCVTGHVPQCHIQ